MRSAAWRPCRRDWRCCRGGFKAATLASLNKNKFMVPEDIRELASLAVQSRDPVKRRVLRKKAQKARREFDARVGALPMGKFVPKLVVTKLWINGRATEDMEVRLHCENCYDDRSEASEKQSERIRVQRCRGGSAVVFEVRRMQITVNRVLRARGKMPRAKSIGLADCLVVEMLSRLPTEVIYDVTHWFQKRFQGDCRVAEAWRILSLVFPKKPDARLEKGLRGFRGTPVLEDLLHEEKEPIEWLSLHVGAERGVNCEHMQGLLIIFCRNIGNGRKNRREDLEPGKFK